MGREYSYVHSHYGTRQLASALVTDDGPIAAGAFSEWLAGMRRALGGAADSDVPCGGCTACCTSSQFVHIGPEETETLARIPAELRFPAPRMPDGHVLLGYDERGHCPMLVDDECSIYAARPRACRTYDCRVFPAAGVEVDDEAQRAIGTRAQRWQFTFPDSIDRVEREAVRAAAAYLVDHRDELPADVAPANATGRAVLAIRLSGEFLDEDGRIVQPELDVISQAVQQ
jgi:uncharacterized protein